MVAARRDRRAGSAARPGPDPNGRARHQRATKPPGSTSPRWPDFGRTAAINAATRRSEQHPGRSTTYGPVANGAVDPYGSFGRVGDVDRRCGPGPVMSDRLTDDRLDRLYTPTNVEGQSQGRSLPRSLVQRRPPRPAGGLFPLRPSIRPGSGVPRQGVALGRNRRKAMFESRCG